MHIIGYAEEHKNIPIFNRFWYSHIILLAYTLISHLMLWDSEHLTHYWPHYDSFQKSYDVHLCKICDLDTKFYCDLDTKLVTFLGENCFWWSVFVLWHPEFLNIVIL